MSEKYSAVVFRMPVSADQIDRAYRFYGVDLEPEGFLSDVLKGDVVDNRTERRVRERVNWADAVAEARKLNLEA